MSTGSFGPILSFLINNYMTPFGHREPKRSFYDAIFFYPANESMIIYSIAQQHRHPKKHAHADRTTFSRSSEHIVEGATMEGATMEGVPVNFLDIEYCRLQPLSF